MLFQASEFMPVSLLTPIAGELGITEGQAGQAISISGFFAMITSLFGNSLLSKLDRRLAVWLYTGVLIVSGLCVTFAPNYLMFMVGRALIGISIGGFWSLSTAILARLVRGPDLPKAIALLQGGTAFASVIAAPLGAFLGGVIRWRGAFFIVVPIGVAGLVWQLVVLPRMPPARDVSMHRMFGLLRGRAFAVGMVATTLASMGQFALFTYLRPYLEDVTGLEVNALSLVLLGLAIRSEIRRARPSSSQRRYPVAGSSSSGASAGGSRRRAGRSWSLIRQACPAGRNRERHGPMRSMEG